MAPGQEWHGKLRGTTFPLFIRRDESSKESWEEKVEKEKDEEEEEKEKKGRTRKMRRRSRKNRGEGRKEEVKK